MFREQLINDIINELDIPEEFGMDIDYDDVFPATQHIHDVIEKYHLKVFNGVSKLVLVSDDSNWVIKIPFRGSLVWNEDWNEETHQYEDGRYDFCQYMYAVDNRDWDEDRNWDYCENELHKYDVAAEAGFAPMFADTIFWGCKDGYPIYLQEKVVAYSYSDYSRGSASVSEDTIKNYTENKSLRGHGSNSDVWNALVLEKYGEEYFKNFFDFLEKYNMDGDLHCGNIGFRLNDNSPILLDWAGWRD